MSRTQESDILCDQRGPAFGIGNDVVKMKVIQASALNALTFVSSPDKLFDGCRNQPIVI